jgi:hypothetical protein
MPHPYDAATFLGFDVTTHHNMSVQVCEMRFRILFLLLLLLLLSRMHRQASVCVMRRLQPSRP